MSTCIPRFSAYSDAFTVADTVASAISATATPVHFVAANLPLASSDAYQLILLLILLLLLLVLRPSKGLIRPRIEGP